MPAITAARSVAANMDVFILDTRVIHVGMQPLVAAMVALLGPGLL